MKKIFLMLLFCSSFYLMTDYSVEKTSSIVAYQQEKMVMEEKSDTMELEVPAWNWNRFIKEGTIDQIDSNFGTLITDNIHNIILAGHDLDWIFHDLHQLEIGNRIVFKKYGLEKWYQVEKILVVSPDQVQYLEDTQSDQLTLITCTENDQKRLIVICKKI